MKHYVEYKIHPRKDGSYDILMKDLVTKKLTIHSNHDTLGEARDSLADIRNKPSQAEAMKMMDELRKQIEIQ